MEVQYMSIGKNPLPIPLQQLNSSIHIGEKTETNAITFQDEDNVTCLRGYRPSLVEVNTITDPDDASIVTGYWAQVYFNPEEFAGNNWTEGTYLNYDAGYHLVKRFKINSMSEDSISIEDVGQPGNFKVDDLANNTVKDIEWTYTDSETREEVYGFFSAPTLQNGEGSVVPGKENAVAFGEGADDEEGTVSVGRSSFAVGRGNVAAGDYAAVFGRGNTSGYCAFTTGRNSNALGEYSFAGGWHTTTRGNIAFGWGHNVNPTGLKSVALNNNSTASGKASFAANQGSIASGENSFAVNLATKASGVNSSAFGSGTTASGAQSAAFGVSTTSSGTASFSIGQGGTKASGSSSFAGGWKSTASATNAFAFGNFANASASNSVAIGDRAYVNTKGCIALGNFNVKDTTDKIFVVGGGSETTGYKDALYIDKDSVTHGTFDGTFNGTFNGTLNTESLSLGYGINMTGSEDYSEGTLGRIDISYTPISIWYQSDINFEHGIIKLNTQGDTDSATNCSIIYGEGFENPDDTVISPKSIRTGTLTLSNGVQASNTSVWFSGALQYAFDNMLNISVSNSSDTVIHVQSDISDEVIFTVDDLKALKELIS